MTFLNILKVDMIPQSSFNEENDVTYKLTLSDDGTSDWVSSITTGP